MEAVYDFLRAALPWVAMGLLLAVFFARSAKKKKDEDKKGDYGTVGMCLGMCFGTAIGTALGNNTGLGISLGMLMGLAIGTSIKKESQDNDKKELRTSFPLSKRCSRNLMNAGHLSRRYVFCPNSIPSSISRWS